MLRLTVTWCFAKELYAFFVGVGGCQARSRTLGSGLVPSAQVACTRDSVQLHRVLRRIVFLLKFPCIVAFSATWQMEIGNQNSSSDTCFYFASMNF